MKEVINKYKKLIILANIIAIGLILILFVSPNKIKNYNNKYFKGKYDSTWKLKTKNNKLLFTNKGGNLKIESVDLKDDYKYSTIDDLYEKIVDEITKQNKTYKVLKKEKASITRNDYDGYKVLLESKKNEVMLEYYKTVDKLVVITYSMTSDYYDILLDSAENIIYNLTVKDDTPKTNNTVKVSSKKISFEENKALSKKINKKRTDEIFSKHYQVKYTIPSVFKTTNYNSEMGYYTYQINDNTVSVTTTVNNENIYEVLERYDSNNDRYAYKGYLKKDDYKNFESGLTKYGKGYIYKHSYDVKSVIDKNKTSRHETCVILYSLNKLYTFEVKIESSGGSIPKELVDMIKVKKTYNYSSNLTCSSEEDNLNCNLKKVVNSKDVEIVIKVPKKYKEVDNSGIVTVNTYETKNFTYGYNRKLDVNDYEIEYSLNSYELDNYINYETKLFNSYSSYENFRELSYEKDLILNEKNFKMYSGGYTKKSGTLFTDKDRFKYFVSNKILVYKLPDGGLLIIKIKGNDKDVSDEIISDFTNFEVKI